MNSHTKTEENTYEIISNFESTDEKLQTKALMIELGAAVLGINWLLITIPNVEIISFSIFFIGYLFRTKFALVTSLVIIFSWEVLASLTFGLGLLVFPLKVIGWLLFLIAGHLSYKFKVEKAYEFLIIGAFFTLIWDMVVTLGTSLFFITTPLEFISVYLTTFIFGINFTIIHVVANSYLFATLPYIERTVLPVVQINYDYLLQSRGVNK